MYLVFTDTTDEFTRIKATLGQNVKKVASPKELIDSLEKYRECRIVIIGPSIKAAVTSDIAAALRVSRPDVSVILLKSRLDVSTLTQAMASGVRDVVDSNDASSLMESVRRCEAVDARISELHSSEEGMTAGGKVIVVYSAKGGCGKTTLATNLAAAISQQSSKRVCLIDLDLQFGDVAIALQLDPHRNLTTALEMGENLDVTGLEKVITRYDDAFDVLLAPTNPSDVEYISAHFVERILKNLRQMYDLIVIDSPPALNDVIIKAFELAEAAYLITTLDMPAIKNLKVALSALEALGFPRQKCRVIVNRGDAKVGLSVSDVEDFIESKVASSIPSSAEVSASTNRGEPIVLAHPRHPVSKAIGAIASEIVEEISELANIV